MFNKFRKKYKERYFIPYHYLADYAETNRNHVLFFSPLLFLFGIIDFSVIVILNLQNIREKLFSLIYFAVFTIVGLLSFFLAIKTKSVSQEKAYIVKNIPVYLLFFTALSAGCYNFYILNQPYNGIVTYFLTGFLSLVTFSLSPNIFLVGLIISMEFMVPGIYHTFGLSALADSILALILMYICSLYKRRIEKKLIHFLTKQKKNFEARTFGNFTLMHEGKLVKFARSKSAELLAYLIYKKGCSANTKELITALWGDKANSARYGGSLRNLMIDIKNTLRELDIQNFFISEYNSFRINPEIIRCDYYDFLEGDDATIKSFDGEFMSQYEWAEETRIFLEQKALKA